MGTKQDYEIETYFREDHVILFEKFEDRSNKMLDDFLSRLENVALRRKVITVSFHNLSRFDGIILLKYFAIRGAWGQNQGADEDSIR